MKRKKGNYSRPNRRHVGFVNLICHVSMQKEDHDEDSQIQQFNLMG